MFSEGGAAWEERNSSSSSVNVPPCDDNFPVRRRAALFTSSLPHHFHRPPRLHCFYPLSLFPRVWRDASQCQGRLGSSKREHGRKKIGCGSIQHHSVCCSSCFRPPGCRSVAIFSGMRPRGWRETEEERDKAINVRGEWLSLVLFVEVIMA